MREDDLSSSGHIDPLAVVHPAATLGAGITIGPFCTVGENAVLGAGVVLESHVVVDGATTLGAGTSVGPFTMLGGPPQHLRYEGEPTRLEVGENVTIREQVSIHRGTPFGAGVTRIADGAVVMAAAHIGHDCQIGKNAIIASNASLAGHVIVGERAFLGGLAGVHQFCRIGAHAMVGGCAAVSRDVIPYGSAFGNHAKLEGLNIVGLKRSGMSRETISALQSAFHEIFETAEGSFAERVAAAAKTYYHVPEVMEIVAFLTEDAKRPILGTK